MIEFKNVSKIYPDGTRAVDNLSMTIDKGELVAFIGTSGSGKTTSMRMINRMVELTDGDILINDKSIKDMNPVDLRRKIGYVIQSTGLMPHMTIYENIVMVPKLLKWDDARMEETARRLLNLVDMDPDTYMDRYPSELSGGQQQRIGVIRALAADQEVILMDEPFSALDPITRETLQDLVKKLQRELGRTVVFVTHDMTEALDLADKIAIISEGKLVQFDSPKNIIQNQANDFVRSFIGEDRLNRSENDQVVEDVMIKKPVTVQRGTSLRNAVKVMRDARVDSLFVVDDFNVLYGLVDFDAVNRNPIDKTVDEIMRLPNYYVRKDTLLRDVTPRMLKHGLHTVVVLDDDYKLDGLLTRTSLVDVLYSSLWGEDEVLSPSEDGIESFDVTQIEQYTQDPKSVEPV